MSRTTQVNRTFGHDRRVRATQFLDLLAELIGLTMPPDDGRAFAGKLAPASIRGRRQVPSFDDQGVSTAGHLAA